MGRAARPVWLAQHPGNSARRLPAPALWGLLEAVQGVPREVAGLRQEAVTEPWGACPLGARTLTALSASHSLHKVLFTEQPETYYKWDNWPPESDRK